MIVVRKNQIWNLLIDNILRKMMDINCRIHASVRWCLLATVRVTELTEVPNDQIVSIPLVC
jgi:hypothetical protein